MRTLGEPPPPGSIVVREGKVKDVDIVMVEADDDRLEREDDGTWNDIYHLSVFAGQVQDGEDMDDTITRLFGHNRKVKWYRIAPPEKLEEQEFSIGASDPEPYHYDVDLGEDLTPEIIRTFEACFGQEMRNSNWHS